MGRLRFAPDTHVSKVAWTQVDDLSVLAGVTTSSNAVPGGELLLYKRSEHEGDLQGYTAGRVGLGGEGSALAAFGGRIAVGTMKGEVELIRMQADVLNGVASEDLTAPRGKIIVKTVGVHNAGITTIAPTHDKFFLGTEAGTVGLIDPTQPTALLSSKPRLCQSPILSLQPLSDSVAAGITESGIFLYDARTDKIQGPIEGGKLGVLSCMTRYAETILLVGGETEEGQINVFDTRMQGGVWEAQRVSCTPTGSRRGPSALHYVSNGVLLVGGSTTPRVAACKITASELSFTPLVAETQPFCSPSFDPPPSCRITSIASDASSIGVATLGSGAFISSLPQEALSIQ